MARRHILLAGVARRATVAVAIVLVAICALATGAPADSSSPTPGSPAPVMPSPTTGDSVGDDLVLLSRSAPLAVRRAEVAALSRTVPAIVLAELDRARAPATAPPPPALEGVLPPGLPPAGWPLAVGEPDGPAAADAPPAPGRRVAALWALGTFSLPASHRDLGLLEIRARYADGLVIHLNGLPVVRRGLPPAGPVLGLAPRLRGPEWETFYVPVLPGLLRPHDNLLAVEVRPSTRSPAPVLEVEVVGRRAARLVVGPLVQRVGPTSATLVVETDRPAAVDVTWTASPPPRDPVPGAPTEATAGTASVGGDGRRHLAELTGLPAGARIAYQVTVDGERAAAASFSTAPGPREVIRVAVYGDVRGGHATHAALVERVGDDAPDLVLFSGDLVVRGTDEADWQRFFAIAAPLLATTPLYPAQGNHDLGAAGDRARRLADRFALPPGPADRPPGAAWYSFDVGDVHVVALDSNAYDAPAQRAWLEADLAAAAGARAVLAITHDGPFSRGTHGGNPTALRDYVPILTRHRVALLFSGHDHLYQRGVAAGLPYVVTGGGGAPLYAVRCGGRGRPRCAGDGAEVTASEHHYLLVTVYPGGIELCARRLDGTPLEPCVTTPLRP